MMGKNKILVIATAFSPENAMGSVRTTKLVKFLVRMGHDVTVVSPELHGGTKIDHSLECNELDNVNRMIIPQSKCFSKYFLKRRNTMLKKKSATDYFKVSNSAKVSSRLKSQFFIIIQFLYTLIRNTDWCRNVIRIVSKEQSLTSFDVIVSSYPSLGAHWSAKKIAKTYGIRWIADFRDPINYESNSNFIQFRINVRMQNSIIKHADYVTYVTNEMIHKLNKKNTFSASKFVYLPNGFDSEDIKNVTTEKNLRDVDKLALCYTGSLYGGKRNLEAVFIGIQKLIDDRELVKEDIVFYYAGKEFNVLEEQASAHGLESILINKGFVSREESIQLQNNSDLIVVVTWNTKVDQGILSGKIYESFLLEKNILGIVNGDLPGSEMKLLVEKVNGGFVHENGTSNPEKEANGLASFIEACYVEKKSSGMVKANYNDRISEYKYSVLTKRLTELFK